MVLIYNGMADDPRIKRISDEGHWFWICLIARCSELGTEVLGRDAIDPVLELHPDWDLDALVDELGASDLVRRVPDGKVQVLARLDLWAFEGEADW